MPLNTIHWLKKIIFAVAATTLAASAAASEAVNLYTDRYEVFLKPVIAAFEKKSGIKVNALFAKKGLLERMRLEGTNSPADVILVKGVGNLTDFVNAGLIQPYNAPDIAAQVLPGYANDNWVSVTRRARIMFVAKGSDLGGLDYLSLAAPENKGKICIRSGQNIYNVSLFADMIMRMGEDKTRDWVRGIKDNLARKPQGKDRTQIKDVAAGVCGIGIANSYYYFQLLRNDDSRAAMQKVQPVVPPTAHIDVTGIGIARHAPHPQAAKTFMRFMVSEEAQEIYAQQNKEFPVRPGAALLPEMQPYAEALGSAPPPAAFAPYIAAASQIVEEVRFNQ